MKKKKLKKKSKTEKKNPKNFSLSKGKFTDISNNFLYKTFVENLYLLD